MWAALGPTPRDSRGVEVAAWRVRRRATESAPPEMATQMRSPGLMLERSKGSAGGIAPMLVGQGRRNGSVGFFPSRNLEDRGVSSICSSCLDAAPQVFEEG